MILDCRMPTKKTSEFLVHHVQLLMKQSELYIKDTEKAVGEIPKGAILVIKYGIGLYANIPHDDVLDALRKQYDKFRSKMIPTEDITKMADFVLKTYLFDFDCKLHQQKSSTTIGTKLAPPYACFFMN